MNLPNADGVEIAREKISHYLLNPLHPDGAGKAAFFTALGFTVEDWNVLADALRQVAASCPIAKEMNSPHGTKYVVDGALTTPCGKTPVVRTVWIIDHGADTPRLVTAYPYDQGD
jgi:hypothetical protein